MAIKRGVDEFTTMKKELAGAHIVAETEESRWWGSNGWLVLHATIH